MSDLYIEARLQAIMEIADSACSDSKDIENINGFCTEIEDFLNKQDVPDINIGDCISRKKLIDELDEVRPFTIDGVEELINNQPQVQPIVRTPEEIAYYKCCKACGLNARCERENQRDCDEFLEMIGWLTKKEV